MRLSCYGSSCLFFITVFLLDYVNLGYVKATEYDYKPSTSNTEFKNAPLKQSNSPILNSVIKDLSSKLTSTYNAFKYAPSDGVSLYEYPFMLLRQAPKRAISEILSMTTTPFELASKFASGFLDMHNVELVSGSPQLKKVFNLPKSPEELFQDLEFATLSVETLHNAIETFLEASLLPLDIFIKKDSGGISAAEYFAPVSTTSLLDIASPKRMAKKLQSVTMKAQGIGDNVLKTVTTTMFFPLDLMQTMVNSTQELFAQLDMMLIIVSSGVNSALNRVVSSTYESLKSLFESSNSGSGWVNLAKNIESLLMTLTQMNLNWLTPEKPGLLDIVLTSVNSLLGTMNNITIIAVDGWENILSQLQDVLANLYQLEGAQLTPLVPSKNTPLASLITQMSQDMIFLNFTHSSIQEISELITRISDRFVPSKIAFEIQKPTLADLNPLNILQFFGDFTKQLLDIDYLINIVDVGIVQPRNSVFDSINDALSTSKNIVQNLLEQVSLNNVRSSVNKSINNIINFMQSITSDNTNTIASENNNNNNNPFLTILPKLSGSGIFPALNPVKPVAGLLRDIPSEKNVDKNQENKYTYYWARLLQQNHEIEKNKKNSISNEKAYFLLTKLPTLKYELEIYEQLQSSECSQIIKEFKIFLLDPSKSDDAKNFEQQYSIVCSKTGIDSCKSILQGLLVTFDQLLLAASTAKLQELEENAKQLSRKLLSAFELEAKLTKERAFFLEKLHNYGLTSKLNSKA